MSLPVVFSPEAKADFLDIYDYIADRGGAKVAMSYMDRIEAACLSLAEFPQRGTARDDIRPGLRVIGFERRVNIAFHISRKRVVIDRVLYGGRNKEAAFR